jgi:hypothetical protein
MTNEQSTLLRKNENSNASTLSVLGFRLHRSSTGLKAFLAFLFVFFLFTITHLLQFPGSVGYLMEITGGQKTFDLSPSFSSVETYERLEAFGQLGRTMYMRTMFTVDLIFPASMFVFLYLFSRYAFPGSSMRTTILIALRMLPVGYVTLDLLENLSIFFLLAKFPDKLEFIGSNIGYLTVGKRIFMMAAIIVPLIALIKKTWGRVQRRFLLESKSSL